ncbi:MAG: D-sedoheptulose 7-phosphate isomerase [bacterium]
MSLKHALQKTLAEAGSVLERLTQNQEIHRDIEKAINLCVKAYQNQGKILICGNGGSACDAAHFAEELVGRYRKNRKALAALALNEAGVLTCISNDFGYENVFSRQIDAFGQPNDIWIGLSTSGNSENILRACQTAKEKNVRTILFLGKEGGALKNKADITIIVPGETSDRIQELHMLLLHFMVEGIERGLFPELY